MARRHNIYSYFDPHRHTFLPWVADRMWLRRVVFPEPRKPVSTVTGTLESSPSPGAADALRFASGVCEALLFVLAIELHGAARERHAAAWRLVLLQKAQLQVTKKLKKL